VIGSGIYVFGGEDNDDGVQVSVFKYDTMGNSWSTLAPMPSARWCYHTASILNGLVYIVGAELGCAETLRYDPASDAWTTLAHCLTEKVQSTSFVLGGRLYAAGGSSNSSSVARYDVDTDTWTAVADMLEERTASCSVTIGSAGLVEEEDLFDKLIATASMRTHP
jgi:N-acetylneuraminic acid mutarotase